MFLKYIGKFQTPKFKKTYECGIHKRSNIIHEPLCIRDVTSGLEINHNVFPDHITILSSPHECHKIPNSF